MEATSAPPILLPGIDHLPCLQEIRSVKDKPFYCQSSVGTIPFQGRVFLLLPFCKQNASLQQLLSQLLIPGPFSSVLRMAKLEHRLAVLHRLGEGEHQCFIVSARDLVSPKQ